MAWLRVSGEYAETKLDYDAVTGGATAGDTGVESGALLIEFAEAVLDRDNSRLEVARRAIVAAIGEDGCLLYTSPSPRDRTRSRMPSSA